ncbi:helical backbone metal receptor [Reichenbachiella sp. MALMAid0571]|uniref:ABC transporter substrate-binding protein n=1 Tax=Reichenbachiella sp. MALMAid0571 TaxID=3143939 RepID=UPI0032E02BFF
MNKTYIDQVGREVEVSCPPKRIISLVPSITELLYYLELKNDVRGITKFCVHPEIKEEALFVGGTKNFKMDKIHQISPDLILANKEENYIEGIQELEKNYPVWVSDVNIFDEALDMILAVGELTGKAENAFRLVEDVSEKWERVRNIFSASVLYFIWHKPSMVAGKNTYIDSVMDYLGFANVADKHERYPELSKETLSAFKPEFVFLSSEPFPFKEKHLNCYQNIFPESKILLVDGEVFSWYGSRMLYAPEYFKNLFC